MEQHLGHTVLLAAVSGALAESGPEDRALMASVVRMARAIFGAAASSIFLIDRPASELVFEAVAGEGGESLVGTRFPADRGIAGWVAASGEPMIADGLSDNSLFARDLAESTGYVPSSIMAAPVIQGGDILGVLQILDPNPQCRSSIADLDLLTTFAELAGLSLQSLIRNRSAREALAKAGPELDQLAGVVRLLSEMAPERRATCVRLVESLCEC